MNLSGKTNAQLLAIRATIESDPRNLSTRGFWRYTLKARRKIDVINRAITFNLAEARKAAGNPVPCDGYSGRQTNKRK